MSSQPEVPRDHPALALYPDSPTANVRYDDGVLWRVPIARGRDEAVPVPVADLIQARAGVARLKALVEQGVCDDFQTQLTGLVVRGTSNEDAPVTRAEVVDYLDGLARRLGGCLPGW